MKKEYINPTMDIVKIEAPQMLAGSDIPVGGNYNGGTIESREFDDTFDLW